MGSITNAKKITMPKIEKLVTTGARDLGVTAALLIYFEAKKAIKKRGKFTIALSGGSTPKQLFDELVKAPFVNKIQWKKIIIAFSDERFVPHSSNESNYKMANETFLKHVGIPKKNILVVPTEKITPIKAAQQYEATLKKHFSSKQPFDLVFLGIGEDGHTASVFPKSPLITDNRNWVQHVRVEEKKMDRISFTIPFINRARNVAFLVSGAGKAAIVKKVFSKSGKNLPAAQVKAKNNVYWFIDAAANGG